MQEIRFTTLEGRQGVFIPTDGNWRQISADDPKANLRLPGAYQDDVFASPQQLEIERAIKEAREAAEGHIAQKKTADRLSRLEAEVKELRELSSETENKVVEFRTFLGNIGEENIGSRNMNVSEAVGVLRRALSGDASLYGSYRTSIATAFYDTYRDLNDSTNLRQEWLHNMTNSAAMRFLNNFIYPTKKEDNK